MHNTIAGLGRKRIFTLVASAITAGFVIPSISQAVPFYFSSQGSGSNSGKVGEYDPATGSGSSTFVTYLDPEEVTATNGNLFVPDFRDGTVGEFNDKTGATINASLITGLGGPNGMLAYGSNLFVAGGNGIVSEYSINNGTATAENTALIKLVGNGTGSQAGYQMALYNNTLFVDDAYAKQVEAYTLKNNGTTAVTATPAFTIPFGFAVGLALSGNNLFVSDADGNIGEYNAATGATINSMFLTSATTNSATGGAYNLVVSGNFLYVASYYNGTVTQFDLTSPTPASTGVTIISGVSQLTGLAVDAATPEPASVTMLGVGAFGLLVRRRRNAITSAS